MKKIDCKINELGRLVHVVVRGVRVDTTTGDPRNRYFYGFFFLKMLLLCFVAIINEIF